MKRLLVEEEKEERRLKWRRLPLEEMKYKFLEQRNSKYKGLDLWEIRIAVNLPYLGLSL